MKSYRELQVWQGAMLLVEQLYELTRGFPEAERFGLTSQLRRSAVSIPSNIAEGYGRSHRGDYLRHLSVARGSLMEAETQLIIAVRLGFVSRDQAHETWETMERVGKMLTRLAQSLAEPRDPGPEPR